MSDSQDVNATAREQRDVALARIDVAIDAVLAKPPSDEADADAQVRALTEQKVEIAKTFVATVLDSDANKALLAQLATVTANLSQEAGQIANAVAWATNVTKVLDYATQFVGLAVSFGA